MQPVLETSWSDRARRFSLFALEHQPPQLLYEEFRSPSNDCYQQQGWWDEAGARSAQSTMLLASQHPGRVSTLQHDPLSFRGFSKSDGQAISPPLSSTQAVQLRLH
mmetsp:Transcript_65893/g.176569  ORF Transcript_65893/g.176569 Transcript_65893/m.176569 type:complete len:106 (+) Transcript_65893:624-941(+)